LAKDALKPSETEIYFIILFAFFLPNRLIDGRMDGWIDRWIFILIS